MQTSHGHLGKTQPTSEERGKDEKSLIAICRAQQSIKRDFFPWEQYISAAVAWWMFLMALEQDKKAGNSSMASK